MNRVSAGKGSHLLFDPFTGVPCAHHGYARELREGGGGGAGGAIPGDPPVCLRQARKVKARAVHEAPGKAKQLLRRKAMDLRLSQSSG